MKTRSEQCESSLLKDKTYSSFKIQQSTRWHHSTNILHVVEAVGCISLLHWQLKQNRTKWYEYDVNKIVQSIIPMISAMDCVISYWSPLDLLPSSSLIQWVARTIAAKIHSLCCLDDHAERIWCIVPSCNRRIKECRGTTKKGIFKGLSDFKQKFLNALNFSYAPFDKIFRLPQDSNLNMRFFHRRKTFKISCKLWNYSKYGLQKQFHGYQFYNLSQSVFATGASSFGPKFYLFWKVHWSHFVLKHRPCLYMCT